MQEQIRTALDAGFPNAEPSPELWERIRQAVPAEASRRRPLSRFAVAAVWCLIVLTGGAAATASPQVQAVVKRLLLGDTGIELAERSDPVWTQLPATNPNGEKTRSTYEPVDPAKVRELVHAEMKLPTYLPAEVTGEEAQVLLLRKQTMSGVTWTRGWRHLMLSMHTYTFGPGSIQGTDGPVQEQREVTINGIAGNAFRDTKRWQILWVIDGRQYQLIGYGLSLEEIVKVAESLQ